jgi:hypothetical protein
MSILLGGCVSNAMGVIYGYPKLFNQNDANGLFDQQDSICKCLYISHISNV